MHYAPETPAWLRRTAILLLLCWAGLGVLHTGYVMVRPHGLVIRRPPELARTIGLPGDEDGRMVVRALELLASPGAEGEGAALVVRPGGAEQPFWDYVHFQLAQLAYPRRIDLVTEEGTFAQENYAVILAPAGVAVGPGWVRRGARDELILYTPAVP